MALLIGHLAKPTLKDVEAFIRYFNPVLKSKKHGLAWTKLHLKQWAVVEVQ